MKKPKKYLTGNRSIWWKIKQNKNKTKKRETKMENQMNNAKRKIKTELYNDHFQNFKKYGIPKAQLVIAERNVAEICGMKIIKEEYVCTK